MDMGISLIIIAFKFGVFEYHYFLVYLRSVRSRTLLIIVVNLEYLFIFENLWGLEQLFNYSLIMYMNLRCFIVVNLEQLLLRIVE